MLTAALVWMMLMYIYVDSFTGVDDVDVHLCWQLHWCGWFWCTFMLTAALVWMMLMYVCVDSSTGVDDVDVHLCWQWHWCGCCWCTFVLTISLVWMLLMYICVDNITGVDYADVHLCWERHWCGWCWCTFDSGTGVNDADVHFCWQRHWRYWCGWCWCGSWLWSIGTLVRVWKNTVSIGTSYSSTLTFITIFSFSPLSSSKHWTCKQQSSAKKQISGLALHLIFYRFSLFNCCLNVVL